MTLNNDIIKLIKKYCRKCDCCGRFSSHKYRTGNCDRCEEGMIASANRGLSYSSFQERDDNCCKCKIKLPENRPTWKTLCRGCYYQIKRKQMFNECLIDSDSE